MIYIYIYIFFQSTKHTTIHSPKSMSIVPLISLWALWGEEVKRERERDEPINESDD